MLTRLGNFEKMSSMPGIRIKELESRIRENPLLRIKDTNKQGFTLIELLVVIVIIAILALIGIATYRNIQASARDTRLKGDIKSLAQALEVNRNSATGKYGALKDTQFISHTIPTSSANNKYCIAYATSPSGDQPIRPTSWLEDANCPEDVLDAASYGEITATNPPDGITRWIICGHLEQVNDVFCLNNLQ